MGAIKSASMFGTDGESFKSFGVKRGPTFDADHKYQILDNNGNPIVGKDGNDVDFGGISSTQLANRIVNGESISMPMQDGSKSWLNSKSGTLIHQENDYINKFREAIRKSGNQSLNKFFSDDFISGTGSLEGLIAGANRYLKDGRRSGPAKDMLRGILNGTNGEVGFRQHLDTLNTGLDEMYGGIDADGNYVAGLMGQNGYSTAEAAQYRENHSAYVKKLQQM